MVIIKNIRQLKGAAVLSERTKKTPEIGFSQYNLIYGFNGSGKSTLSRVFAALQKGSRPEGLPLDCTFEVEMTDGTVYACPDKLAGLETRVCVFNTDFVEENLHWADGKANPVFTISAEQGEAVKKLAALEGVRPSANSTLAAEEKVLSERDKAFATYKRERARTISERLRQTGRKYEATQLVDDYKKLVFDEQSILSDAALNAATDACARAEPFPKVSLVEMPVAAVLGAVTSAIELCPKTIGSVVVEGLDRHPSMVTWVKVGHDYHVDNKLSSCLYCGSEISEERRELLSCAFDDTVASFIEQLEIEDERARKTAEALRLAAASLPKEEQFSAEIRVQYAEAVANLLLQVDVVSSALGKAIAGLSVRRGAPTAPVETGLPTLKEVQETKRQFEAAVAVVNALCEQHNSMVDDFTRHQEEARISIRRHFLADGADAYNTHIQECKAAREAVDSAKTSILKLEDEIAGLRAKVQQHGPAASKINELVKAYLGHGELTIAPVDRGYELHRRGNLVKGSPSEGEKTAIALCYFLSTLEADGKKAGKLIVIIDDPISSLDTKAMNYACALIRGRLSNVAQLLVMTHNQHCMNEFKKAWKGLARAEPPKVPKARLLYIDVTVPNGSNNRSASIVEMSSLLREYDSEYHFLFQKVLQFEAAGGGQFEYAFMMPNVLRRVIEVFLAFKIPRNGNINDKLAELCRNNPALDPARMSALERLSQVESHSDNLDDLISHSSMTVEEARDANAALLFLMAQSDPEHLAGLRKYCKP
ncbi:AAA family ATPase [Rhodoplanes sp. TEM]|uniref:AAA family ATPase n=1 Tax=Rhodoplanes tepidamans TaxID=200616 RepID=A0ABT5JJZ2_RHOTP|nr:MULTISPECIES: AAA family ATPase [Rhodoplanes]MDC7789663.1 AAA family ATPase [Rhodoplanes tepidamans]MDC7983860.1 AAA family ATPase [Rhodoplanes sp. TEM]MDQ0359128.1 wobble nucleotide-excising tRNase [Rhodoplanes tepidamans]